MCIIINLNLLRQGGFPLCRFYFFGRKAITTHENQRIWKKNQLKTA